MLKSLKDLYSGQRCFIVATGKSLQNTDLSKIKNSTILGLNRAYLYKDIKFDYLFVGDYETAKTYKHELVNSNTDTLVTSKGIYDLLRHRNKHIYFTGHKNREFCFDISSGVHGGQTITFVALQFALYMGFSETYLVGLDFSYDHFDKDYLVGQTRTHNPDFESMLEVYTLSREAFKVKGKKLLNASVSTNLPDDIIRRVNFEEVCGGFNIN